MRRICLGILLIILLTGCASKEKYETVSSCYVDQTVQSPQNICVIFPQSASVHVIQDDLDNKLLFADDYTISLQTLEGGDIQSTVKGCTGYDYHELSVIQTRKNDLTRYDCVWSAAGEGQDMIGRMAILDDGVYHYVLSVMSPASDVLDLSGDINLMFNSFCVNTDQ